MRKIPRTPSKQLVFKDVRNRFYIIDREQDARVYINSSQARRINILAASSTPEQDIRRLLSAEGVEAKRSARAAMRDRYARLERLEPKVEKTADGHWIWRGRFQPCYSGVPRPMLHLPRGIAWLDVRKGMFRAVTGRWPKRRHKIRASCGRFDCVSPEHLVELPYDTADSIDDSDG